MKDDTTEQRVLFTELVDRPLHMQFDQPDSSSDGGALLLKAADQSLGLTQRLSQCLRDKRNPDFIIHSYHDMLRQRIYGICCGYEDCNDAARLAGDPIHRLMIDRDPQLGQDLASQPTLSRFENAIDVRSLDRMGEELAEQVVARHHKRLGKKVKKITIDMDPTDDPTYGQQQLTFFNSHYANWCYLPVAGFLQFNDEPDQYLFCYVLRPGDVHASYGAIAILRRIIKKLRQHFPGVTIQARLDGGYATPEIFEYFENEGIRYVIAMAKNAVLKDIAEPLMEKARWDSYRSGNTEHHYGECRYESKSWEDVERRVVYKAEVVRHPGREPRDNLRCVVTNFRHSPQNLYEKVYCYRGEIENRIKELLYGLSIDRTSCTSFLANQFRVLMAAASYVLMQELRLKARHTSLHRAQVGTLRERLLKMAVWVEKSTRRYVIHMPDTAPWRSDWCQIARQLGAVPT
jgi:hypothetical protein